MGDALPCPAVFVCGLGRCGTSLVLQMLDRGGVPALGRHPAFECEEATRLPDPDGSAWLRRVGPGHAVKLLDPHRWGPPADMPALVVWLDRNPVQQAASQMKLATALGLAAAGTRADRRSLRALLLRQRRAARAALEGAHRMRLTLRFEDLIDTPAVAASLLARFLAPHYRLDAERAAGAVLPRRSDCLPGLMEADLLERAHA